MEAVIQIKLTAQDLGLLNAKGILVVHNIEIRITGTLQEKQQQFLQTPVPDLNLRARTHNYLISKKVVTAADILQIPKQELPKQQSVTYTDLVSLFSSHGLQFPTP